MRYLPLFIAAVTIFPFFLGGARAELTDSLTPVQIADLKKNQTVVVSKDLPNEVWPELTLYRKVNTTPAAVYALLTDLASAPSYSPGMISAEVVAQPSPDVKDVRYTVSMPVVSNMSYTVRNEYLQKNGVYEVRWRLLESPVASASRGSLTVEAFGQDGSILRYKNHVTPSMPMAGFLKGQALKEAKSTIEAIDVEAVRRVKKK